MKTQLDRRVFLGSAAAGLLVVPGRSGRAAPSERVRVAVIGLRSRGTDHVRMFAANPGAEVAAVCDIDDAMFAKPVEGRREGRRDRRRAPRKTFAGCSTTNRSTRSPSPRPTTGTRC